MASSRRIASKREHISSNGRESSFAAEVRELSFSYPDGTLALDRVDLDIHQGERLALMGLNGAGKSTFLMHLNGILRGSGDIRIEGRRLTDDSLREIRRKVGFVFQNPDDQLFSPTVWDDVAYGPLYMGLDPNEIAGRVERALEAVGMSDVADKMPHHLSLGQRKRVSLATVLSMEPAILVLDEPSAGLDPRSRRQLIELLKTLPQTMIISTHDMRFASEIANRALIMFDGQIVADGAAAHILADAELMNRYGLELP